MKPGSATVTQDAGLSRLWGFQIDVSDLWNLGSLLADESSPTQNLEGTSKGAFDG